MTLRTLVASKNISTINRVKKAFENVDCEIITAPSLSLAIYLARKNFPDTILTDLELTDGDGLQLLHEIRAEKELQAIPFALLEGSVDSGMDDTQAHSIGIATIIAKDVQGRELYEKIMKLIRGYLAIKEERAQETPE